MVILAVGAVIVLIIWGLSRGSSRVSLEEKYGDGLHTITVTNTEWGTETIEDNDIVGILNMRDSYARDDEVTRLEVHYANGQREKIR